MRVVQRIVAAVVMLAATSGATAPAAMRLPTLTATGTALDGRSVKTSFSLGLLDARQFDVVRRSASSVTLGFPALGSGRMRRNRARHCALATFRLSVTATGAAPDARADELLPDADERGASTVRVGTGADGRASTQGRAWRIRSALVAGRFLRVRGVLVEQTAASTASPFLRELMLTARTVRAELPCGSTNRFTVGPRLVSVLYG